MKDPRTESVLKSVGVGYKYDAEYPLDMLASDERTQVRFAGNIAQPKEVQRYVDLLEAGAEFPPIVILPDGRIVDGNTRWGAFRKRKRQHIAAYIADTTSAAIARRIGAELNAQAGRRMERAELAQWLGEGNGSVSEEDARRITGWSRATINRVRGALQFEARRTKLDISLSTALPDDVKAALNAVSDPDVFRDLTHLAHDAGFKPAEVRMIVKQANEAAKTDVAEARRIVIALRGENQERIQERHAGMRVTTPLFQQMSMHIGWLVKQGASGLHDHNPHTSLRSRDLLESAAEVIAAAIDRY